MEETNNRLIDKTITPDAKIIKKWIGNENYKLWDKLQKYINEKYPDIFPPDDWIYGGKKYGWSLRYKKSKSFCTFIPEKDKFLLLIVFGNEERNKTEAVLSTLSPPGTASIHKRDCLPRRQMGSV